MGVASGKVAGPGSAIPLLIPPGEFDAYIFDCDGTITDSMPLHHRAWCEALSRSGCPFPEPLFYEWAGTPTRRIVELLNEKFGLRMSPEAVTQAKERHFLTLLPEVAGIAEVLQQIRLQHGRKKLAVASGSDRAAVLSSLKAVGVDGLFDAVVGAEDYARGKPEPDAFLKAAELLGVVPGKCLVFEDAELGIRAAEAAGMKWVKVPQPGRP